MRRKFFPKKRKQSNNFPIHKNNELLSDLNESLGLALNDSEMKYLNSVYQKLGRAITDAELKHVLTNKFWNTVDTKFLDQGGKLDIPFHMTLYLMQLNQPLKKPLPMFSQHKDNSCSN